MAFRINDQMTCSIFIAGKEFLLDYGNGLKSLHLKASALSSLPELSISFVDTLNQMPNFGLQDGAQIVVQINGIKQVTRQFRVHNWRRSPLAQGFAFKIDAYWDAPKYWVGTSNAGIQGSSSQALQQIAQQCGLKWMDTNTNTGDAMLWLQGNRTYANFARDIARAGYVSDTSHMVLSVDSQGFVRYSDVNRNPAPKVTVGYTPSADQSQFQRIIDFTPHTKSGTLNLIGGYRHSRYVQPVSGSASGDDQIDQLEDELQFQPDAQYPLLSSDIRDKMSRGSVSYAPLDWGNVHPNFERARYQNARYNLLNSLYGEFLFPNETDWEPGDNFSLALPADLDSTQYNGEYTVQSKIIFVQGSTYNEQIVAVKNGLGS